MAKQLAHTVTFPLIANPFSKKCFYLKLQEATILFSHNIFLKRRNKFVYKKKEIANRKTGAINFVQNRLMSCSKFNHIIYVFMVISVLLLHIELKILILFFRCVFSWLLPFLRRDVIPTNENFPVDSDSDSIYFIAFTIITKKCNHLIIITKIYKRKQYVLT